MRTRSTSNGCASPMVPSPLMPVKACETCWLNLRKCPFGERLVSIDISDKFILFMPRYPEPFYAQVDELQHPCAHALHLLCDRNFGAVFFCRRRSRRRDQWCSTTFHRFLFLRF